ncbi:MAG: anti-sigma F factor [Ruminococcaceae bacterium]|nr:anti-sigma F factor [Oscillospiraceae bacterium]
MILNEFKLTVNAKSINEGFCRVVVSAFVSQLDPTIEELADLKTAVSEAVTNSIVHGYKDSDGKIYITSQVLQNNIVSIKIKDKGIGIDNINQAMEPLFTTGEGDRAGLGFTVMQSFCDRVKVSSASGKGTTVTLIKKINGKSQW